MNPRVKKVKPEADYQLSLTFENGEKKMFDMRPYLSVGVFKGLKQPAAFRSVRPTLGTVQWKGGQDLCPDTLYEESKPMVTDKSVLTAHEKPAGYNLRGKKSRKRK